MGEWQPPIPKDYRSVEFVAARFRTSRTTIFTLISNCALLADHIGGRTIIHKNELKRFERAQRERTGKVYNVRGEPQDAGDVP